MYSRDPVDFVRFCRSPADAGLSLNLFCPFLDRATWRGRFLPWLVLTPPVGNRTIEPAYPAYQRFGQRPPDELHTDAQEVLLQHLTPNSGYDFHSEPPQRCTRRKILRLPGPVI